VTASSRPPGTVDSAAPQAGVALFDAALASFDRAVKRIGVVERRLRIAGDVVRLVFAGPALVASVARALRPREIPADGPGPSADLEVCIYDSASTGIGPPPIPSGPAGDAGIRGYLRPEIPSLNLHDPARGRAVHWVAGPHRVPAWDVAAPLRPILQWRAEERGAVLAHAAAVGRPGAGVLLVGKGGSGKSTAALACGLRSSLLLAGDDYVLVEPGADGAPPRAHALYATAKLGDDSLARFPELSRKGASAGPRDPATGKRTVFLDEVIPERLAPEIPVRAILLPRVTDGARVRAVPASPGHALLTLAPSTIFQCLEARADLALRTMRALVASVPCLALEVGADADLAAIPAAVEDVLS